MPMEKLTPRRRSKSHPMIRSDLQNHFELHQLSSDDAKVEDTLITDKHSESVLKHRMKDLHNIMNIQGIKEVTQALRDIADKWMKTPLNIAVTGSSGAGKSALINALRNVKAEDKGGAQVGVKETTTKVTPYRHPNNPSFIVWDMPGVGTPKYPKAAYLDCVEFDRYDFFLIISNKRFTENDQWLAKQIKERQKRFYFIRSHIDLDIYNDGRANPGSHTPRKVLRTVRMDCYEQLTNACIETPLVFLVDSFSRESYDFGELEGQLLHDTKDLKIEAMALSLSTLTKTALQKKYEVLESRIENIALRIAFIESFCDQKELFESEMEFYKKQFNLDDEAIQNNKGIDTVSEEKIEDFQRLSEEEKAGLPKVTYRPFYRRIFIIIALFFSSDSRNNVFTFFCLSLKKNLEEMFTMALGIYGLKAHKDFVETISVNSC